ncbi:chromate transporter [Trinickia terrae]|uniref:Chromate transporter n=1 Tax=Trinickia terrae TaxID=2571161 RepID=A0A4U1HP27_9BURK|nr:chromate transporter [Trinickia terrae]TKC83125.1 chromate transporter [Trinickia terrae]
MTDWRALFRHAGSAIASSFLGRSNANSGAAQPAEPERSASHDVPKPRKPESLWTLFCVVFGLSSLSWGGLALMAQLENHYVERDRRFTRLEFADWFALAWMVPGPVGCNVAVQVGHALRGRAGAWVAGAASVLPFFALMTVFASFYQTSLVRAMASQMLLNHFSVVLASLIAVTWCKQMRTIVRGQLGWTVAALACVALIFSHGAWTYVALLSSAFAAGWFASPSREGRLSLSLHASDWRLLGALAVLIALFAIPLPHRYETAFLWPRLAGAGMTLFGGGFSALPVLKTLFVTPAVGVSDSEFTLAFALSPVSPGPLLNVVPFLGYLTDGWLGAVAATLALFVPSGCLIVLAQRHLKQLETYPRFEHGMRALRAATTAFLVAAVVRVAVRVPLEPAYLLTAAFACLCFGRLKVPVYAVYGTVAVGCGLWIVFFAHA